MNKSIFVFILFIFLSLFFLANKYVVSRGLLALDGNKYQRIFQWTYWILALTFVLGQFLERGNPHDITKIISSIGSFWLGWFFYLLLIVILVDFLRLFNYFLPFIKGQLIPNISNGVFLFYFVLIASVTIVFYGYINARSPIVNTVKITLDKPLSKNLKVVLVSDLHIGAIVGNPKIKKMVDKINQLNPDIVLIAGDLVDHNPKFAIKDEVGKQFLKLHPPMGIYAITGNHEYIGQAEVSIAYLSKFGIHYLRDSVVKINNEFYLAGREDRQMQQIMAKKRQSISQILSGVDKNLPVILMDHQPVEYNRAIAEKVDLMVSGHTHKGQMWPMNYITKAVFENHYGLYKKMNTWFYTSNGYGTWGPPIRVGNRPEIVVIEISSNQINQ